MVGLSHQGCWCGNLQMVLPCLGCCVHLCTPQSSVQSRPGTFCADLRAQAPTSRVRPVTPWGTATLIFKMYKTCCLAILLLCLVGNLRKRILCGLAFFGLRQLCRLAKTDRGYSEVLAVRLVAIPRIWSILLTSTVSCQKPTSHT